MPKVQQLKYLPMLGFKLAHFNKSYGHVCYIAW